MLNELDESSDDETLDDDCELDHNALEDNELEDSNELDSDEELELDKIALPTVEVFVVGFELLPPPPQPASNKIESESDKAFIIFMV